MSIVTTISSNVYAVIGESKWASSSTDAPIFEMGTMIPQPVTEPFFMFRSACSINETYGYLIGIASSNVYFFRVSSSSSAPELAMVFREAEILETDTKCVYNADSDNLYIPMLNASGPSPHLNGLVRSLSLNPLSTPYLPSHLPLSVLTRYF